MFHLLCEILSKRYWINLMSVSDFVVLLYWICPTHGELDEGVFRKTVHIESGLEKTWEGRPLTHRHPVAWTLKSVKGEYIALFIFTDHIFHNTASFMAWKYKYHSCYVFFRYILLQFFFSKNQSWVLGGPASSICSVSCHSYLYAYSKCQVKVWTWMPGEIYRIAIFVLAIGYILPLSKFKRLSWYKTKIPSSVMHF